MVLASRFAIWLHNDRASGDTESGAYYGACDRAQCGRNPGPLFFIPIENEWYKAAHHQNDGDTGNYSAYPTSSDSTPSNDLDGSGNNNTMFIVGSSTLIRDGKRPTRC